MLTVKDLFDIENMSIDIVDDYDERCYVAFDYGFKLTEAGEEEFSDALDLVVNPSWDMGTWCVHCENARDANAAMRLFNAIAGYCGERDFDRWFKEV